MVYILGQSLYIAAPANPGSTIDMLWQANDHQDWPHKWDPREQDFNLTGNTKQTEMRVIRYSQPALQASSRALYQAPGHYYEVCQPAPMEWDTATHSVKLVYTGWKGRAYLATKICSLWWCTSPELGERTLGGWVQQKVRQKLIAWT